MSYSNVSAATLVVAPVRERGLKWYLYLDYDYIIMVAPVRERGLKS